MTLYDTHTKANREQMELSLTLASAIEEFQQACEDGNEPMKALWGATIKMIIEQMEPIEE